MKIVLDTNCLIPILVPGSFGHDIWQAFRNGRYTLCVSSEILFEYEELLMRMTGDNSKVTTFQRWMSERLQNF